LNNKMFVIMRGISCRVIPCFHATYTSSSSSTFEKEKK